MSFLFITFTIRCRIFKYIFLNYNFFLPNLTAEFILINSNNIKEYYGRLIAPTAAYSNNSCSSAFSEDTEQSTAPPRPESKSKTWREATIVLGGEFSSRNKSFCFPSDSLPWERSVVGLLVSMMSISGALSFVSMTDIVREAEAECLWIPTSLATITSIAVS